MSIFRLARHPTRAIRAALLALLMLLGVTAFAHAGHSHDPIASGATTLHSGCGYCATFNGLADAPRPTAFVAGAPTYRFQSEPCAAIAPVSRTLTSGSPRGPPQLQLP